MNCLTSDIHIVIFWQTQQPPHNLVIMSLPYYICFALWKEYCTHLIYSLQSCQGMIMNYELSNIQHAYCNFLANMTAISQSCYNVLAILYLLCITERILHPSHIQPTILLRDDNET